MVNVRVTKQNDYEHDENVVQQLRGSDREEVAIRTKVEANSCPTAMHDALHAEALTGARKSSKIVKTK
jgi:hypothetical protein